MLSTDRISQILAVGAIDDPESAWRHGICFV